MYEFKDVTKIYEGDCATIAVDDVNFALPDSGMVFLVGKSGAGKSTILNLLGGLDKTSQGKILYNGTDIEAYGEKEWNRYRKETISFCFQKANVLPYLTVEENIRFDEKSYSPERVKEICGWVDLAGMENRKASTLSGGQQQRVAIGRALYRNSPVLLCDEPTGSLDSKTAAQIFECLQKFARSGRLALIVTHDEASAMKYGDRIIRIADGKIVSDQEITQGKDAQKGVFSENYKRKTSHLSGKLMARSLFHRPVRLTIAGLLLGISLGILTPILSSATRDSADMLASSITKSKEPYIGYTKDLIGSKSDLSRKMYAEDVSALYPDGNSLPVYAQSFDLGQGNDPVVDLIDYVGPTGQIDNEISMLDENILQTSSGLTGINPAISSSFRFSLLAGRYPQTEGECMITKAQYDALKSYGFHDASHSYEAREMSTPTAFLAQKATLNVRWSGEVYPMDIVGILDTNFEDGRYQKLKNGTELEDSLNTNALSADLAFGPHTIVFVSPAFEESKLQKEKTSISVASTTFTDRLRLAEGNGENFFALRLADDYASELAAFPSANGGMYVSLSQFLAVWGSGAVQLPDGIQTDDYQACVKPFCDFSSLGAQSQWTAPSYLFASSTDSKAISYLAAGNYVKENGLPTGDNYSALVQDAQDAYQGREGAPDFSAPNDKVIGYLKSYYVDYLAESFKGYKNNAYGGPSGLSLTKALMEKVLQVNDRSLALHLKANPIWSAFKEESIDSSLAGVGLAGESYLYVSQKDFDSMKLRYGDGGNISYVIRNRPSMSVLASQIRGISNANGAYQIQSPILQAADFFGSTAYQTFLAISLGSSGLLLIVSILLCIFLYSAYARDRATEMLLRRAMGSSKGRVYSLLTQESLGVGAIGYVVSIGFGFLLTAILNSYVAKLTGWPWTLFSITWLGVLLTFVAVLAVTFLSSIGPAFSGAKKGIAAQLNQGD